MRTPQLGNTDNWDAVVPPPTGTARNAHISQGRRALPAPLCVKVHYTRCEGQGPGGPRRFPLLFMLLNFRGARMERTEEAMRWDTEAQTFLAPSPWPRRGGRGWAREQSSLPRPACPEPTVTQVKTRSARSATSGVRRLPFRALFSLSGSASGSSSRLRVSRLGDIPTCPGLRPGRGRSESRRAPPPCPTRRAPRPGSTGNPAPSVHPDGAVPAPTLHPPRPAHLRPLPA